jgi:hypothetical protein
VDSERRRDTADRPTGVDAGEESVHDSGDGAFQRGSWYVAVIVSESSSEAPNYAPLYEEAFLLVRARSLEQAAEKARAHIGQEAPYTSMTGQKVSWSRRLVEVGETLYDNFEDGREIYARFFRNYNAYELLEFEDLYQDDFSS